MSDDLRTRIAAAIQNANESGVLVGYGTMADAVIRRLWGKMIPEQPMMIAGHHWKRVTARFINASWVMTIPTMSGTATTSAIAG